MSNTNKISIPRDIFEQIFFKEGGQKKIEKATVGEYQYGLNEQNPITSPNSEVERGEYVKDSQGIREFLGETHENGGIKVKLEDGAKILSDHLKIGKVLSNLINKELGIKTTPTDTFAKVLKKYTQKSGLKGFNDEMEAYVKKAESLKDVKNEDTAALNTQHLSGKINDITKQKQPLEKAREGVFDFLFAHQEDQKDQTENKTPNFAMGGMYGQNTVEDIARKYNIPVERAYELLPKHQGGVQFSTSEGDNVYKGLERKPVTQPASKEEGFGEISINKSLQSLLDNFPDLVMGEAIFKNDIEVVDGVPKFKSKLSLNQQNKKVLALQKAMHKRMTESADELGAHFLNKAKAYKEKETFIEGSAKSADKTLTRRDYDEKWGEFTAGRFILGLDVVTPEEKTMLAKEGIRNLKQLKGSPLRDKLSKDSLDKISRVEKLGSDKDFDFTLNTYDPQKPAEAPIDSTKKEPLSATLPNMVTNKKLGIFAPPQNFRLTPMQWQHKTVNFRDRLIDPVLMSPEQTLAEISRASQSQQAQINMLPDNAKAAAIAGSGAQEAIQKSVTEANRFNAQAKYNADLYNTQAQTNTDLRNAQESLRFDQVSALSQDNNRKEWQNYFTANDNDRRRNYDYAMQLNAYNALNPNVQFTGTNYEVQDPYLAYADKVKADMLLAQQQADEAAKAKKKTPIKKNGGRFKR